MKEHLLLLLPAILIVGVPLYSYFRHRMVQRNKTLADYSKKRVLRLTAINLALNFGMFLYSTFLLVTIVGVNQPIFFLTGVLLFLYFLTVAIVFYGNGIYITAIVIENYTVLELKKRDPFRKQFVATHLFHGPVSHFLIYSGWIVVFLIIALIDSIVFVPFQPSFYLGLLVTGAIVAGFAYGMAQVFNGTSPYQLVTGLVTLLIALLVLGLNPLVFHFTLVMVFFIFLNATFNLTILGYFLFLKLHRGKIEWDRFGYGRISEGLALKKEENPTGLF